MAVGNFPAVLSDEPTMVDEVAAVPTGGLTLNQDYEVRYRSQSVESSTELLIQLGRIFDVQQRAVDQVDRTRARLAEIARRISGKPAKSVLVAYPGMAVMNNNGLPAEDLFTKFPHREASRTRTFTSVSDSIYPGPFNAIAVRKIADAAHGTK